MRSASQPGHARSGHYTSVILAGGAARRLGGVDKPNLAIAGVPIIMRVLRAVADANARVVVGPVGLLVPAEEVLLVRERPPGGGPVAAVAAAFEQAPPATDWVAILGGDLPLLTNDAIARLRLAAAGGDGAIFVDQDEREQWLCGVWRTAAIKTRLGHIDHAGTPLRQLFADLDFARMHDDAEMPVWFDCDTAEDIERVEEWLTR